MERHSRGPEMEVKRLKGDVLAGDHPRLTLMRKLGFVLKKDKGGETVWVEVSL
jgi:hypothetical protein